MTVQRLGEQTRGGSFADATRAGKKIRVMESLMLNGIAQRTRDGLLAGDFVESLRAPLTCDYLVGHKDGE